MRRFVRARLLVVAGAAAIAAAGVALAQDPDDLKRGVARISLINGDVSVRRGDTGDWVAATVNAPLVTGDWVSAGPNSRAEVQFDAANLLRMGAGAEVRLVEVEYGRYQMEVAAGVVNFRVLRKSGANIEVDTPNASVRPEKQGTYRILVGDDGVSEITVRSGDVEVFTPRGAEHLNSGRTMMVRGTPADPEFQIVNAPGRDEWDRWNEDRDRFLERSASYRYVGSGVYGVEDLDSYGSWVDVAPYGYCWRPSVVTAGWAPYQSGRWVWEDWYGWTWVSYDPWGWAPYHYGRWFNQAGGWYWYPGGVAGRHYWSPALVAFFGFGGVNVGVGFGNVGWVPLGPHEPFHHWWGRSYYAGYRNGGGINNYANITNINITNEYRNSRARNGITAVGAGDFSRGRFNNVVRVSGDQLRGASLVRGQVPIAPGTDHLRFTDRQVTNVPRALGNRQFFAQQKPGTVDRVSFAQQQRSLEPGSRIPLVGLHNSSAGAASGGRGSTGLPGVSPARNDAAGRTAQSGGTASPGWQHVGSPSSGSVTGARVQSGGNEPSRGWRTLGGGASSGAHAGAAPQAQSGENAAMPQRNGLSQAPAIGQPGIQRNNGAWHGTGGSTAAEPQGLPGQSPRSSDQAPANGRWNRFGEPGAPARTIAAPAQPAARGDETRQRRNEAPAGNDASRGWNNFGNPGGSNSKRNNLPAARTEPRTDPRENFAEQRSAPRAAAPQSIRIAPPVVRERPNQGGGQRSGGESRGQGGNRQGGNRGSRN